MGALSLPAVGAAQARSAVAQTGCPEALPTLDQARTTIERGIAFLERDAARRRKERGCAICHHGTMTVWALSEALAGLEKLDLKGTRVTVAGIRDHQSAMPDAKVSR